MFDFVRTLLGIRRTREVPPPGPLPKLGATLVRNTVKMKVTQPMDPSLWNWLQLSGWRVNSFRKDRRRCTFLPPEAITRLMAADPSERDAIQTRMLRAVENRARDAAVAKRKPRRH